MTSIQSVYSYLIIRIIFVIAVYDCMILDTCIFRPNKIINAAHRALCFCGIMYYTEMWIGDFLPSNLQQNNLLTGAAMGCQPSMGSAMGTPMAANPSMGAPMAASPMGAGQFPCGNAGMSLGHIA